MDYKTMPPDPGQPQTRDAKAFLLIFLALFALVFILFWRAFLLGEVLVPADILFVDRTWQPFAPPGFISPQNPLLSDQFNQFFVWQRLAGTHMRDEGYLPLWNPYELGGQPLVANYQGAFFYPPNWLLWLLDAADVAGVRACFNLLVAGTFTYLFCRRLACSKLGASLAAVSFMLCGPLTVWLGHPLGNALVCLPWLMWAGESLLSRQRRALWTFALGMGIGVCLLGGHPETSFHVLLVFGLFFLTRLIELRGGWKERWKVLAAIAGAGAIGLALSAVQVLPFLEFLANSVEFTSGGRSPGGETLFYSPEAPQLMATAPALVFSQIFGNPVDGTYRWPFSLHQNFNEQTFYFGLIPLSLASAAVVGRRARRTAFALAGLAVFCLGLAWRLPGFEIVNHLPPFSLANNRRLLLEFAFLGAVLAAIGLDEMVPRRGREESPSVWSVRAGGATLALAAVGWLAILLFAFVLMPVNEAHRPSTRFLGEMSTLARGLRVTMAPDSARRVVTGLVAVLAGVSWWAFAARGRLSRRSTGVGLLVFTLIELLILAWGFNPTVARDMVFPQTPFTEVLRADRGLFRVLSEKSVFEPNYGVAYGFAHAEGYDLPVNRLYAALYRAQGGTGRRYRPVWSPDWPLVDWMNVKYVFSTRELASEKFRPLIAEGGVTLYENTCALPRAFVVHAVDVVADDRNALATLTSGGYDFRQRAVVDGALPEDISAGLAAGTGAQGGERVQFVDYSTDEVTIRVDLTSPGLLVMSDVMAPGWVARVDGVEARIYRTNYAFRGVPLRAGTWTVEFLYRPVSFQLGRAITLSSLAVLAIGFAICGLARLGRRPLSIETICRDFSNPL